MWKREADGQAKAANECSVSLEKGRRVPNYKNRTCLGGGFVKIPKLNILSYKPPPTLETFQEPRKGLICTV